MTLFNKIKQMLSEAIACADCKEGVLCFSIVELPNPRDTGHFEIRCGRNVIACIDVTLDEKGVAAACQLIAKYSSGIRRSAYREVQFDNISDWAKVRIEAELARLGLEKVAQ